MPNQRERQLLIENFQDSLRLVRHLMNFGVEKFAEAIGVTRQTVNNMETKKSRMSPTQYIAIAALTDSYFAQNPERFTALKAILDGEGKEYKTAFRDDSLIKRWFEGIIYFDDATKPDGLADLVREYKLILDAELLTADDAPEFAKAFTEALLDEHDKVIVPFRSIEALGANAYQAKKILNRMYEADVLQIHGEKTDPDFRDTVIEVFKRFRNVYRLCLLTSDENLAQEILQLNDSAEESDFETSAVCLEEGKVKFYERLKDTELNEDDLESWEEL